MSGADTPDVARAVALLREGGLVALPTETVYGLAADASNEVAVRRVFAVKGRPETHPLIVHLPGAQALDAWARDVPPLARRLAVRFWPGPLTLVLRRTELASDAVTGGQDTVALRVPAHPLALAVLQAFGGGLAAPSANRFGRVSPTTADHVREDLGDEVDLVLDGGPCAVGVESTILDLSRPGGPPAVLRPGGLALEAIEHELGMPVEVRPQPGVRVPGTLPSHYAPRAGVVLADAGSAASRAARLAVEGRRVALVAPASVAPPAGVDALPVPGDAESFARVLYATLREVDARGADVAVVVPPHDSGLGRAVRDRLRRASAGRP